MLREREKALDEANRKIQQLKGEKSEMQTQISNIERQSNLFTQEENVAWYNKICECL